MCGPSGWKHTRLAPGFLAAALLLAFLLGCAGERRSERFVLPGGEHRVFLILPLNVAAVMPTELELPSPVIWKELELYLRAQGRQLKTISRPAARDLWLQSIQHVRAAEKGARAGFDDAARALAFELQKHAEFDALIVPSLFVGEAPISNRSARWDGVERELEFDASGLGARNLASTPLEGNAPAASIHVAVFDANGDKLHDAKRGLDLLVRVRVLGAQPPDGPSFEFADRSDPFENREHLRASIRSVFAPFLPFLPE